MYDMDEGSLLPLCLPAFTLASESVPPLTSGPTYIYSINSVPLAFFNLWGVTPLEDD